MLLGLSILRLIMLLLSLLHTVALLIAIFMVAVVVVDGLLLADAVTIVVDFGFWLTRVACLGCSCFALQAAQKAANESCFPQRHYSHYSHHLLHGSQTGNVKSTANAFTKYLACGGST